MFTGIIKSVGKVILIEKEGTNVHFTVKSDISKKLKIDQSVSHDGVCLTVVAQSKKAHRVTAIAETLVRSNLGAWQIGALVNLERCMKMNARLDGHIVQGHVDCRAKCLKIKELKGSWRVDFAFENKPDQLLVDKGSVTINGISLTVVEPSNKGFSVAIIPYTWANTNFHQLRAGDFVNIEFDIIGKYVARLMAQNLKKKE